ncbi:DHCW motif cupin fold protein [Frigidibacter sp. ROC022]|uniref:DHCW motif cupin fold protein n=1 Tax=Frigidibacter sp. ROC022 TaxID=2971796 RepID=UPI00215A2ECD|nr:DHCW motif cupin fold protein [Frigidibacter sp. ROC022]MCR8725605.1 DHCW motif cupin fold protein [Frigidibacter sp. ROC022]
MQMPPFAFETVDWAEQPVETHPGETGEALWQTRHFGPIRVRIVTYSPGYLADHWCEKGHVLYCLDGELETELADGRTVTLTPGCSYQVGDGALAHRSRTRRGARLFIVD